MYLLPHRCRNLLRSLYIFLAFSQKRMFYITRKYLLRGYILGVLTHTTAWMLTCIFFVFGALGGYAFLLWRKKKSCLKRHRKRKMTDEEAKTRLKNKEEHRSRVDDFFLVFFPGKHKFFKNASF